MKNISIFTTKKVIFLLIGILSVSLFAILKAPLYEVFVDVQVDPPEEVRRTDFSWITVGQWFTTQAHIITSYTILKDVRSEIGLNRLRRIVSAKRLGAADIIRISIRSDDNPVELEKTVNDIADLYLKRQNGIGRILTLPTLNILPGMGFKLLLGCPLGFLLWLSSGVLYYKNW